MSVAGHPRLLALSSFVCAVNSYTVNLFYNDTPYNDIVHFDYKIHYNFNLTGTKSSLER